MGEQMTTAERIEKQLNDIHDTYPGSVYDCFRVIAKEIAAEIDGLRDELAVILRERNDAHLALAERTRERDEARDTIAANRKLLHDAGADFDRMMRERDEARAEADRLRPAAEAWEAYDDYMTCPETEEAAKFPVWIAAHRAAKGAQAARAAKESQP